MSNPIVNALLATGTALLPPLVAPQSVCVIGPRSSVVAVLCVCACCGCLGQWNDPNESDDDSG